MSRLSQEDRRALELVKRQLLTGNDEKGHLTEDLMLNLNALRPWLDTWVIPKMQRVLDHDSNGPRKGKR